MQFNWVTTLASLACPIYFEQSYLSLFANHSGAKLVILQLTKNSSLAFLPLELQPVGDDYWEASSAYGYGGLWSDEAFFVTAEEHAALLDFLQSQRIIAVFLRHAPFAQNQYCWPENKHTLNRITYTRELEANITLTEFCASSHQKIRWSINAALRQHLVVEFQSADSWKASDVKDFYRIYHAAMSEKKTNPFYLFDEDFFLLHASAFGRQCELAIVRDTKNNQIIAGALFLMDTAGWVHYHLSALMRDYPASQFHELLLAESIVHYGNRGYTFFHIGGGHTLDESDGLSLFKKKFATKKLNFDVSTWICNEKIYYQERQLLPLQHPTYFLINEARGEQGVLFNSL